MASILQRGPASQAIRPLGQLLWPKPEHRARPRRSRSMVLLPAQGLRRRSRNRRRRVIVPNKRRMACRVDNRNSASPPRRRACPPRLEYSTPWRDPSSPHGRPCPSQVAGTGLANIGRVRRRASHNIVWRASPMLQQPLARRVAGAARYAAAGEALPGALPLSSMRTRPASCAVPTDGTTDAWRPVRPGVLSQPSTAPPSRP